MSRDRTWLIAAVIYATGNGTSFAGPAPIEHFEQLAHRACPDRKLEYLLDGDWQLIILDGKGLVFGASAERGLSRSARHFSKALSCRDSPTVDCDVAAGFDAIEVRGLMREAVQQICRTWRCADEATCTYSPKG